MTVHVYNHFAGYITYFNLCKLEIYLCIFPYVSNTLWAHLNVSFMYIKSQEHRYCFTIPCTLISGASGAYQNNFKTAVI